MFSAADGDLMRALVRCSVPCPKSLPEEPGHGPCRTERRLGAASVVTPVWGALPPICSPRMACKWGGSRQQRVAIASKSVVDRNRNGCRGLKHG